MSKRGIPPSVIYKRFKIKIEIICEGLEEVLYLKRLLSFHYWNELLDIVLTNANGISSVYSAYSKSRATHKDTSYFFILCDSGESDSQARNEFNKIIGNVNNDLKGRNPATDLVIFANPCTMQIFLSHFEVVMVPGEDLKVKANKDYICAIAGVSGYSKTHDGISSFMKRISRESYKTLKENLLKYPTDYHTPNSTNALSMLTRLESQDLSWTGVNLKEK